MLSILGIFMCSQILLQQVGGTSTFVKQVCGNNRDRGCNAVLKSKVAVLLPGISLGDVGIMYFSFLFVFVLLSTLNNNMTNAIILIGASTIVGILFSMYSIWYQKTRVKTWCKLCLLVMSVIWTQAIVISIFILKDAMVFSYNHNSILLYSISALTALTWIFTKPLLAEQRRVFILEEALMKWERNPTIFINHLQNQPVIHEMHWPDDIRLGNPEARIRLLVVCSPYCVPCAKAHKEIEDLLEIYDNQISITIRFNTQGNGLTNTHNATINHIINAYKQYGSKTIEDWFRMMNLKNWQQQYHPADKLNNELLEQYKKFCAEANITHTPTFFINGYKLSKEYNIKNIQLLLPVMAELIAPKTAPAVPDADAMFAQTKGMAISHNALP
ncbi:MAG: vitamin K epoxide reductase family protein [Niabella sp.]